MARWLRILLGPLPATLVLVPMLLAGGLGTMTALVVSVAAPGQTAADRWSVLTGTLPLVLWVAAAVAGVLALWVAVLAASPAALGAGPERWWIAAGLLVGAVAAGRWLWLMMAGRYDYVSVAWALWLVLLAGPIVLSVYYLLHLLRLRE